MNFPNMTRMNTNIPISSKDIHPHETSLDSSLNQNGAFTELSTTKAKCEDDGIRLFFSKPPEVKFVVSGIEFPCHKELLSKRSTMLHDLVLVHGIQSQVSKKQRIQGIRSEHRHHQKHHHHQQQQQQVQESLESPMSLLPSVIVVVKVEADAKIFRALLEFLYSNELPDALYWDDEQAGTHWVSGKERSDAFEVSRVLAKQEEQEGENCSQPIYRAMSFLQRLLVTADQFGVIPLKHEVEYRLYDEFLYSFTAAELFVWADSNSCAFLKEKAMDRLCRTSSLIDDCFISKAGRKMIPKSQHLLDELFAYANEGCHTFRFLKQDGAAINHESKEQNYYKVEYLRMRLSDLGLDIDGTREMLEDRLRPHLDVEHRNFLPTRLTKGSRTRHRVCPRD